MQKTRKRTVLWLAGLSLVAVLAVVVFAREGLLERWYIYRLDSSEFETVDHAATQLAAMKSSRAIEALVQQVPKELERGRSVRLLSRLNYWSDSAVLKAIHDLGDEAKATALKKLENQLSTTQLNQSLVLQVLQPGTQLLHSKDPPLHQTKILERLQIL